MMEEEFPVESPRPMIQEPTLTFAQCLEQLILGKTYRRLSWEDEQIYIIIRDGQLMIWRTDDKRFHPLIVSVGDIEGVDWILTKKGGTKDVEAEVLS